MVCEQLKNNKDNKSITVLERKNGHLNILCKNQGLLSGIPLTKKSLLKNWGSFFFMAETNASSDQQTCLNEP